MYFQPENRERERDKGRDRDKYVYVIRKMDAEDGDVNFNFVS